MPVLTNIAIGSNVGSPVENVREAIRRLAALGQVIACSNLYMTKAWGVVDQADFCNAAIKLSTQLSPEELLAGLQSIEQDMGRTKTFHWGPRVIDLDILTFGDLSIDKPNLVIPHPHLSERIFVLVPLAEIDSGFLQERDKLLASMPQGEPLPVAVA